MARQKTIDVTYQRRTNPKTGKSRLVPTKKIVTKATNVSKGANTGSRPWNTDRAALRSEEISAKLAAHNAEVAGRSADIATISATASNIARNVTGAVKPSASTEQVSQAVQGGLTTSNPSRDDPEDDEDDKNPYVI